MAIDPVIAEDLRETLRPIWRRLMAERTISVGKVGILGLLVQQGPATAATLASAERVSPQAIATAVRELEALGLIVRHPDTTDRRRVWIDVTEAGRARLAEERAVGTAWLDEAITDRLTDDERATLRAAVPILRKLTAEVVDD